jgi:LemA protein
MKSGSLLTVVLVLLLGFAGCAGCGKYNSLVGNRANVDEAWANVESQYQRRVDLIPNLVNTVKGAMKGEQQILTQVVEARSKATSIQLSAEDLDNPEKVAAFQQAQAGLSQGLGRLLAVSENYPQLQSIPQFRDLQAQIEGTENRINRARDNYNGVVKGYNVSVQTFPGNIVAGIGGFKTRPSFQADAGAEKAPKVQF